MRADRRWHQPRWITRSKVWEQTSSSGLKLAEGAVRAGIECLLQRAKLQPGQIEAVRIAGALGGALSISDLKGVAMLPKIMLEKCRFHGAGVLDGLKVFLLEKTGPVRVKCLAGQLKTYPLSGTPAFEKAFLAALDFHLQPA